MAVKEALHKRTQVRESHWDCRRFLSHCDKPLYVYYHYHVQARVAYHHALMEVEHRASLKTKLEQQGKIEKVALAEGTLAKAQQAADDAKKEFDLISERFLRDFDR